MLLKDRDRIAGAFGYDASAATCACFRAKAVIFVTAAWAARSRSPAQLGVHRRTARRWPIRPGAG